MTRLQNLYSTLLPMLALAGGCAGDDTNGTTSVANTSLPPGDGGMVTMGDGGDDGTVTMGDDGDATGSGDDRSDTPDTGMDGDTSEPGDDTEDGSDTGPPAPPVCQHQCTTPQDCNINGDETGLGCNAGVCSIACTDDPTCVAAASGWTLIPCDATSECSDGGGVCVDTGGGVGGCSLQPSQGPCSDAGLVEMPATTVEGQAVTVCGQPNAICVPLGALNVCIVDCIGSPCGGELTCGEDGLCHCDFDTQCVEAGTGNNCNAQGLCEWACQQPTDCPAHPFDGGTAVCE